MALAELFPQAETSQRRQGIYATHTPPHTGLRPGCTCGVGAVSKCWPAFASSWKHMHVLPTCTANMYVLPTCMYCQHACTATMHVLPTCMYCQHACTANMYVLPTCMYCQHVCTANMYVLPTCMYCQHVCTANMHILPTCMYCQHACTANAAQAAERYLHPPLPVKVACTVRPWPQCQIDSFKEDWFCVLASFQAL
jgi:hypothetical protein